MITILTHVVMSRYLWTNPGSGSGAVTPPAADTFGKLISPALCQATSMTN